MMYEMKGHGKAKNIDHSKSDEKDSPERSTTSTVVVVIEHSLWTDRTK